MLLNKSILPQTAIIFVTQTLNEGLLSIFLLQQKEWKQKMPDC